MRNNYRRVVEVIIGSVADEKLKDRCYFNNGQRGVFPFLLPGRAKYLIETKSRGIRDAERKALKLAKEDGIPAPVMLSASTVRGASSM